MILALTLAKQLGYPSAEDGYHWILNSDGKLQYDRNTKTFPDGNERPKRVYDPETETFIDRNSISENSAPITLAKKSKKQSSSSDILHRSKKDLKNTERFAGGSRQSSLNKLSQEDIERLTREFIEIGGDPKVLRFNNGAQTGYVDKTDRINIRGDVMPLEDSVHPRSNMTSRAVLAHELGHRAYRNTKVPIGDWNDEFRASYWAAKNIPNLTLEERASLIQDAILRAQEAGVTIQNNSFMRKILYGYE